MSSKQTRPPVPQGARSATQARRAKAAADTRASQRAAKASARASKASGRTRRSAATDSAIAQRLQGMRLNLQTVTFLGLIVLGIVALAPQAQTWYQQRQLISDYQAQVEQAKKDLAAMKVERKRWNDPVYIRSQARDRLYYVLPGEVSYLVMDANGISTSDVSGTVGAKLNQERASVNISSSITRAKKNWVNALMQSVVRAGIEEPVSTDPKTSVGN
ncbi:MAG: hypothetical protein RJA26_1077 [Actinomycetota bacterium]